MCELLQNSFLNVNLHFYFRIRFRIMWTHPNTAELNTTIYPPRCPCLFPFRIQLISWSVICICCYDLNSITSHHYVAWRPLNVSLFQFICGHGNHEFTASFYMTDNAGVIWVGICIWSLNTPLYYKELLLDFWTSHEDCSVFQILCGFSNLPASGLCDLWIISCVTPVDLYLYDCLGDFTYCKFLLN